MGTPQIRYESGQTAYPFEALTNSGDHTKFTATFAPISAVAGYEPTIAPYGLMTGGAITPTATNNQVAIAALTASMAGVAGADQCGCISVSAGNLTITRAATNVSKVNSLTVNSSGALAAVAGVDGATVSFVETRGAAGGPPYIPDGSIEIGQVRTTTSAAAVVTTAQIYTVLGLHVERSDYPVYSLNYATGDVTFAAALDRIHTGDITKRVYLKGSTPLFAPISNTADWAPAESTYSISSTATYDGPVGSASSSLGQASFTMLMRDGITDGVLAMIGKEIWVEFRPDRDKSVPKQLTQGIFGASRTFPAGGGSSSADCTVTPRFGTVDVKA